MLRQIWGRAVGERCPGCFGAWTVSPSGLGDSGIVIVIGGGAHISHKSVYCDRIEVWTCDMARMRKVDRYAGPCRSFLIALYMNARRNRCNGSRSCEDITKVNLLLLWLAVAGKRSDYVIAPSIRTND